MSRMSRERRRADRGPRAPKVAAGVIVALVSAAAGFAVGLGVVARLGAPRPAAKPPVPPASREAAPPVPPAFTEVTAEVGITFRHEAGVTGRFYYPEVMGAGCAFLDYDADGDLDIYLVNGNRLPPEEPSAEITNVLYRQNGDGTFSDVTREAGVGDPSYGQGCCAADTDGDGDQDLYVTNFGPNVLYRNRGDGRFEHAGGLLADPGWGQSCAFFDADGDGDLDLYLQNYLVYSLENHQEWYVTIDGQRVLDYCSPSGYQGQQDRLFLNQGDGTFRDVTETSGIVAPEGTGMGLVCADLDQDGDQDIAVANDSRPNFLFRNQGGGTFVESGLATFLAFNAEGGTEAFMGIDAGDTDGDGRLELVIPSLRSEGFNLYRNLGELFEDASVPSGLQAATSAVTGFAPVFLDYDADGDLDLFATAGDVRMGRTQAGAGASFHERYAMRDLLLENRGGRFVDVTAFAGPALQVRGISRACAAGDYDDDGDLDLLVTSMGGPVRLLRNDTRGGRWVGFVLEGRPPNRDAVGARLLLRAGGRLQVREVYAGGSYLGQRDRRQLFGLGAAGRVEELTVRWPGGGEVTYRDLAVNRYHRLREEGP